MSFVKLQLQKIRLGFRMHGLMRMFLLPLVRREFRLMFLQKINSSNEQSI